MKSRSYSLRMLPWIGLLLIYLAGCAGAPEMKPEVPFHRSKDYVVYPFQISDTAESLAGRFLGDTSKAWIIEEANEDLKPGSLVVIPLKSRNPGGIRPNGVQQIPILCYHRFGNGCASPLCMPAEIFQRQMQYLKDHRYHVIGPDELLEFLEYRRPLPRKSVMITIDDGYRSVYNTAYPILKKFGYPATLFVYTDYVGVSRKAITWKQLRELKDNGFTIGSHTVAHSDLSKKGDSESEADYRRRLQGELVKSKEIIDRKLGQDTYFFAYPFGRANVQAVEMTRRAGYKMAVTVDRGGNPFYADPYLLRRDQILKRDMATFQKRLNIFQTLSLR